MTDVQIFGARNGLSSGGVGGSSIRRVSPSLDGHLTRIAKGATGVRMKDWHALHLRIIALSEAHAGDA
jgi:hypothetical protein